ncbi:MAG: 2-C-methyl-D-erythritol 4-phosphate cytidylyltransferase [Phocaeicola sp.]|uniref:2-C-methyl-D-erythritol 4-phosphate cytidylyltransferase n=1 Tax=Phocaeicola TaxID=909656 RepID=UPI00234F5A99|nr:2-C-methyl-D-erythritol 4-phosphate cytidylyltransferase [Phocaeicola oris]MCE2617230.1 2-C-methyl-D-erythritol 4-phosphate cytidylyltransferase [Phocaeicola oris]
MNKFVIIVAGGKGLRMGSDTPKQFLLLAGKPVLMRTIEAFYYYDKQIRIILVLPDNHQSYWRELCSRYNFNIPVQIVSGGETRFHSVKRGLDLIMEDEDGLVGIHDGVRPFVSENVISRCYKEAEEKQAVIPAIDVYETIRQLRGAESVTVPRNLYKLAQTPQVFNLSLLKAAYKQPYSSSFTDDASVVEALGKKIFMIEGNRENIKITTPLDLKIGELLLKQHEE